MKFFEKIVIPLQSPTPCTLRRGAGKKIVQKGLHKWKGKPTRGNHKERNLPLVNGREITQK